MTRPEQPDLFPEDIKNKPEKGKKRRKKTESTTIATNQEPVAPPREIKDENKTTNQETVNPQNDETITTQTNSLGLSQEELDRLFDESPYESIGYKKH